MHNCPRHHCPCQQITIRKLREGVKKTYFFGDLSQIWVGEGADSQTFGDIYQQLFFRTKVPKCVCGGAVKTQNQIQILGEIY